VFNLLTADDSHASHRTIGSYHLLELIGQVGWARSGWQSRRTWCAAA
jgi:hypothetical protein